MAQKTRILKINSENPQLRLIRQVVEVLKAGGVIVYPTDTVYGIGCNLMNKRAIERNYQIKRRRPSKPFSFICSGLTHISQYAKISNFAYKTMRRLLPGPYTFILEGTKLVPRLVMTKRKTVGIRVPDNNICLDIVAELGNPIVNTSATDPDGDILPDPYTIEEVYRGLVDLVVDGGYLISGPSSVISLVEAEPVVIREGEGDVSDFK